ncbi:MAG TPA: heme biosynthesis HemY N-terminal domain-containing protein [Roseiarcus sp.]|jgi:HemY protein
MVRLLLFLVALALAGYGLTWLAENPGEVALTWRGVEYDVSLIVALGVVVALAVVLAVVWGVIRFVFRIPSLVSLAARARKREKGLAALTRGMIAVGSGDVRTASRDAAEARKHLRDAPLAKLLRAQAAQLAGDRPGAAAAFKDMLEHPQTHALGLRGLHIEARRSGDHAAALEYAARAHKHAALPWAAQAVLDDRAAHDDWAGALAIVESNAAAKLIDKPTANRWRAVLKTALAQEIADRDPHRALSLAQEANALAPSLVPAAALAGRLHGANGDYRRAAKILEAAYRQTPHPDLAAVYLRMRRGDSANDRLARAKALARLAPSDPESLVTVGRAALDARDLDAARAAVAPLLAPGARPTARVCLLMADIEDAAGAAGAAREWLARAARAPRDRAWVAEGVISDRWAPVSPSGVLDAFVWRTPEERLTAPEPAPAAAPPTANAAPEAAEPLPTPTAALPAAPPAPAPAAAPPKSEAPRAATVMMLPTTAPDDPGPQDEGGQKSFRLFARE